MCLDSLVKFYTFYRYGCHLKPEADKVNEKEVVVSDLSNDFIARRD